MEPACRTTTEGFSGHSYDNTLALGADTLAPRGLHRAAHAARRGGAPIARGGAERATRPTAGASDLPGGRRRALADVLRRLQALHRRRLPGRLPDGRAVPHRVRHGGGAAGRLQRLRLLRAGLPLRRDRPARGRRPRLEVHALLRPPEGRHGAGLRAGLPDRLDPVRRAGRAARARRAAAREAARRRARPSARLYGADPDDGVGGFGAFFLLLDEPEVYGLPPDPVDTTRRPGQVWARPRGAAALGAGSRAAVFAGEAGSEHARERAMVRRAEPQLLLRPAGDQGAGVDAGDPLLLLHRRPGRRVRRRWRWRAELRGNRELARRAWAARSRASASARCC